jgi:hypothetical protein
MITILSYPIYGPEIITGAIIRLTGIISHPFPYGDTATIIDTIVLEGILATINLVIASAVISEVDFIGAIADQRRL